LDLWLEELREGRTDAAWDHFLDRYRRLIFSAIRHYTQDPDDVMDVFAHVCESLHVDGLARLRRYAEAPAPGARFSTWLVTVVRNQTVDFFRHRDGRPRHAVPAGLSPLEQQIFQHVFVEGRSHEESFQLLAAQHEAAVSSHLFAEALRETYRVVDAARGAGSVRRQVPLPVAGAEPSPDERVQSAEGAARMAGLLDTLDSVERLAIQLFVIDELAAADVARIVGWPNAKMVYNRVARALVALRRQLEHAGLSKEDF